MGLLGVCVRCVVIAQGAGPRAAAAECADGPEPLVFPPSMATLQDSPFTHPAMPPRSSQARLSPSCTQLPGCPPQVLSLPALSPCPAPLSWFLLCTHISVAKSPETGPPPPSPWGDPSECSRSYHILSWDVLHCSCVWAPITASPASPSHEHSHSRRCTGNLLRGVTGVITQSSGRP